MWTINKWASSDFWDQAGLCFGECPWQTINKWASWDFWDQADLCFGECSWQTKATNDKTVISSPYGREIAASQMRIKMSNRNNSQRITVSTMQKKHVSSPLLSPCVSPFRNKTKIKKGDGRKVMLWFRTIFDMSLTSVLVDRTSFRKASEMARVKSFDCQLQISKSTALLQMNVMLSYTNLWEKNGFFGKCMSTKVATV